MIEWLIYYELTINLLAFVLCGIDKYQAKRGQWRIPEWRLIHMALFGGGVGALFGMYVWRHKTQHKLFVIGVPLLVILHFVFLYYAFLR